MLLLAIGIVCLLCVFSMWRVLHLSERLGPALSLITPRLMGLILAVIAVRFILDGVEQILPRLAAAARPEKELARPEKELEGPEEPEKEQEGPETGPEKPD